MAAFCVKRLCACAVGDRSMSSLAGEVAGGSRPDRALRIGHRLNGTSWSLFPLVISAKSIEQPAWLKAAIVCCERLWSWVPNLIKLSITIVACRFVEDRKICTVDSSAGSPTVPSDGFFRSSAVVSYGVGKRPLTASTYFLNLREFSRTHHSTPEAKTVAEDGGICLTS